MNNTRSARSIVLAIGCAAAVMSPARANAEQIVINPGLLFTASFGGPRTEWGFGVECSVLRPFENSNPLGVALGGVGQAQWFTDGTFRAALAAEVSLAVTGFELGFAFRSGNGRRAPAFALHAANFLSVGYSWVAYNLNVNLGSPAGVPRLEHMIHFGPKLPLLGRQTYDPDDGVTPTGFRFEPYSLSFGSGRPLRDDAGPCLAGVAKGEGWISDLPAPLDAGSLDGASRVALTALWIRDARFEHASVASFARLSLELMALGAPPALLRGAHEAAIDEVEHARACFAIASMLAGGALAPGALPEAASRARTPDLVTLAVEAFEEGCVGEGVAAAQCAAAAGPSLPAVGEVLARIAVEEGRHAALAWSVLGWCLAEGGDEVARALRTAAHRALRAPTSLAPSDGLSTAVRAAWGRLPRGHAAAIARRETRAAVERLEVLLASSGGELAA